MRLPEAKTPKPPEPRTWPAPTAAKLPPDTGAPLQKLAEQDPAIARHLQAQPDGGDAPPMSAAPGAPEPAPAGEEG